MNHIATFALISNLLSTLLVLGILLVVAGAAALCLWLARGKLHRRKRRRQHPHWAEPQKSDPEHAHRHRHRKSKGPMNPTLADAGGLPERRPTDGSPPASAKP